MKLADKVLALQKSGDSYWVLGSSFAPVLESLGLGYVLKSGRLPASRYQQVKARCQATGVVLVDIPEEIGTGRFNWIKRNWPEELQEPESIASREFKAQARPAA